MFDCPLKFEIANGILKWLDPIGKSRDKWYTKAASPLEIGQIIPQF